MNADRIRLAVPNKGRLAEPTIALLRDAGLEFEDHARSLLSHCENFALDLLFVRTEDLVEFVGDGVADLGITGGNLLAESGAELPVVAQLGYGRCRLEAAVSADSPARSVDDLAGFRLATSHPSATSRFFGERGVPIDVVPLTGAVEVAPRLGVADGIVDLVSTGSTLLLNGLRSVGVLLESEAVLVASPAVQHRRAAEIAEIQTMLGAVVAARRQKYLMMNAPLSALAEIEEILPGLDSPSIVPLAHGGMVAVHAVVASGEIWGLLGRLRRAGASGILVVPVEKLLA
ncbi:MAG: ATP phosphoribosyltransferase [Chloroflexota bacterium]|nr:ATP phosphoribosyltransferase [Chloroflexota bacterium]